MFFIDYLINVTIHHKVSDWFPLRDKSIPAKSLVPATRHISGFPDFFTAQDFIILDKLSSVISNYFNREKDYLCYESDTICLGQRLEWNGEGAGLPVADPGFSRGGGANCQVCVIL